MAALAGEAELLALQGAAHQALPVVGGGGHRRAAAGEGFGGGVGWGRSGFGGDDEGKWNNAPFGNWGKD